MSASPGIIVPQGYLKKHGLMSLRDFYLALTETGEETIWLIQPSVAGENIWLFTCEWRGVQMTHTISEDMFTEENANTVREATYRSLCRGAKPKPKFITDKEGLLM